MLLLPLFAMQITDEVKWDAADFAIFGAMLAAGFGATAPSFPEAIVFLTGFFAALWLLSAWLFRKAAWERAPAGVAP